LIENIELFAPCCFSTYFKMSLLEVDDWKLLARAVVKLKRRDTGAFASV